MHIKFLQTAAFLGALSVILGAFGAHGLKKLIDDHTLNIYETAVRYQFYHVFALALVGILYKEYSGKLLYFAGIFFIIGIGLFSGSLYILTYKVAANSDGFNWVGPVTPIGGMFFIIGWICLALGLRKK
jgi:uncharacterized membrane protein YgdD (TMEM256/DUF423 family)